MAIVLTYRRTSRLSMRIVKNGDVHVSAPIGMARKEVEAFVHRHQDWIVEARKKTAERQQQRAAFYHQLPLATKAERTEATERIRALVEPMLERHAREMGVSPNAVSYRPMISRWGVCKVKDRSICYSTEPSHNARFHALMDKFYPRWRAARQETRRIAKEERGCD